jgi:hypothetical protein
MKREKRFLLRAILRRLPVKLDYRLMAGLWARAILRLRASANRVARRVREGLSARLIRWRESTAYFIWCAVVGFPRRLRSNPARNTNPNTADYFSEQNLPIVADAELGVWNRPNHHFVKVTRREKGEPLTTSIWFDRFGARVPRGDAEIPPQVDLIVVGESNTWGQGIAWEETYSALIAKALNMTAANLALINSSGVQNLLTVKRFISRQPRLILFALWEEHFWSNVTRCPNIDSPVCLARPVVARGPSGRPYVSLPRDAAGAMMQYRRWYLETAAQADPAIRRDLYWTARLVLHEILLRFERFRREGGPWPALARQPGWIYRLEAVQYVNLEMKRLADSVGGRLVVIYLPFFFEKTVEPPPQQIVEHAAEHGIAFISMDEKWRARRAAGEQFYFAEDLHLDARGHRDIADSLLGFLRQSGWFE